MSQVHEPIPLSLSAFFFLPDSAHDLETNELGALRLDCRCCCWYGRTVEYGMLL